jgi:peptide/nickel transport system substrate-binding protein
MGELAVSKGQNRSRRFPLVWRIAMLSTCVLALFVGMGAGSLKYTEDRTPTTLNPLFADDMYSVRMTELIFDGLLGYDKEQRIAPALAVAWSVAPDKRSIVFTLRKGVKWHDGKPFTSKDVAFTIASMTSRKVHLTDRYLSGIVKRVQVLGPYKVKVFFKRPLAKPALWFTFKIIKL